MRRARHLVDEERAMNYLLKLIEDRRSMRGPFDQSRAIAKGDLLAAPGHMKVAFAVRLGYPVMPMPYLRVRREVAEFTLRNLFEIPAEPTRRCNDDRIDDRVSWLSRQRVTAGHHQTH
jgi:hypothetical protein